MDELIRKLEHRAQSAERARGTYSVGSSDWHFWNGGLVGIRVALMDARAAKRRMADREPAWGVQ